MTGCLDEQMLKELYEVLGDELKEITGQFIGQLDNHTELIVASLANGDLNELSALAHGLKGSAGNMGAVALARVAASIEKLANAANQPALEPLVANLPQLSNQTIHALRASGYAPAESSR